MLVEENTLKKVKDLGLNSYEAKIWTALLSRGVSTAGEISDIANVPRSRSYDVLESLEKKGFIIMKVGKPIQYIAVPPLEALDRVKKDIEKQAETQFEMIDEFTNSHLLDELNQLHNEGIESVDPTEITGYMKGRENVYNHIGSILKKAKESVVIATSKQGLQRLEDQLTRAFNKTQKNGVQLRVSAPTASTEIDTRDNVELKNTGLRARFIVVDNKTVIFFITPEETHQNYETAIWVESAMLAETFMTTFEQAWSNVKVTLKTEMKAKH